MSGLSHSLAWLEDFWGGTGSPTVGYELPTYPTAISLACAPVADGHGIARDRFTFESTEELPSHTRNDMGKQLVNAS